MAHRRWRSGDFWSGTALAALGLAIVLQARQWEYLGLDGPGAGFFPLWYGIAMLILACILAISAVVRRPPSAPVDWAALRRALAGWAALAVAMAAFAVLGFTLSYALLTFFIVAVLYRRPRARAAWVSLLCAAGFYVVFALVLGVPLPAGLAGF